MVSVINNDLDHVEIPETELLFYLGENNPIIIIFSYILSTKRIVEKIDWYTYMLRDKYILFYMQYEENGEKYMNHTDPLTYIHIINSEKLNGTSNLEESLLEKIDNFYIEFKTQRYKSARSNSTK